MVLFFCLSSVRYVNNHIAGVYCGGVPPLPIPNRAVKPACADGTAMQCGRVGGRLFSTREPRFCQEPGLPFSLLPQASPPWGRRRGRAKPAPCNLRSPAPRIPAPGEPDGCQRPGGTRPGPRTKRHDFLGHGGVSNFCVWLKKLWRAAMA